MSIIGMNLTARFAARRLSRALDCGWRSGGRKDLSRQVGRNDPCPCGSGRKFKRCCLDRAPTRISSVPLRRAAIVGLPGEGSSRFRFQAGSYGGPLGYLPSIACLKREATGDWAYHFVLVVPDDVREDEESASLQAGEHLFAVFQGGSSPDTVANGLKEVGYISISGFRVVAEDASDERGFVPAMDPEE